jgi:hypothetical protein
MTYSATARPALVELQTLVTEIEGALLRFASSDARTEWSRFRETCASAAKGEDLEILVGKARRFRAVLLVA